MVKSVDSMTSLAGADPVTRVFMLFIQAASAVPKYADARFNTAHGLSASRYVALLVLAVNKGTMRPVQMAEWTGTRRHNITALVDRLSREGLVVSRRNEKDKRVVEVSLTRKGWETFERASPVARNIMETVMGSVTAEDAAALDKVLKRMMANIENAAAG